MTVVLDKPMAEPTNVCSVLAPETAPTAPRARAAEIADPVPPVAPGLPRRQCAGARLRQKARDIESGRLKWVRGTPSQPGTACVLLSNIDGRLFEVSPTEANVLARVTRAFFVARWNDADMRTEREVIDALYTAAGYLDAL